VFTDDATRVTEWICSEVEGTSVFIPAVGATESGDQVRVAVDRNDVASAPAVGGSEHISDEEEAALYRHYGIPHSREASSSLLPTGEPQPGVEEVPSAPAAGGRRRALPVAGGLAAASMAVGVLLGMRRLRRRRPPTRRERILARGRAASSAVGAGAGRITAAAVPLLETSKRVMRRRGAVATALPVAAAVTLPALRRRRSATDADAD
jgi:hypothetical protein